MDFYKEVLKRRGIIEHTTMRGPGLVPLDAFDQQELDAILADISELFTLASLTAANGPVPFDFCRLNPQLDRAAETSTGFAR